ncbi:hypothetical protein [Corynebacterium massiliense]|uniref:Prolipoprotein LppL n=2 Tax=Corynebacterium massiliense TaxID=441501 RepID=A0ABY7U745_9CORY|nr:hypothetical protein [Corynebacterium massiliense]WCZ32524.1 hypothetical protein CMASS_05410 [Corynebacterium massiliense DSM 45435]
MNFPRRTATAVALAATLSGALAAAGCQANTPPDDAKEAEVQGNATPAESPRTEESGDKLAGDILNAPRGLDDITDLESIGTTLAARSGDTLAVGSVDDFRAGKAKTISLPGECGDITTATDPDKFVAPCGDEVLFVPADSPADVSHVKVDEEFPVTAATVTETGDLYVTSRDVDRVAVYRDGSRAEEIRVEAGTDQLLAVGNGDKDDGIVRLKRADTTIQSLDLDKSRAGGRLRVGQGLGEAATSRDGVIVVSDTIGKRIAIYTDDDVVRLHQLGLTDGSPWAVAWDAKRQLAWATTTDNNKAQAFDISTGVPEPRGQVDTLADAQSMTVLADGTVVFASATGEGIQVVSDPALDK